MQAENIRKASEGPPVVSIEALPWPKIASGKVREIFDLGDELLIVASDRLSAFDVILPDGISAKGIVLTQLSLWWFQRISELVPNHLADDHENRLDELLKGHPELRYRSMLVRKLKPLPIEAVVRGYLAGSGWEEYCRTGKLFEFELPEGLGQSAQLPEPLFTPSTKAQSGHDEPIDLKDASELVGEPLFSDVHRISMEIYKRGVQLAEKTGIILADTKFEFGTDEDGKLFLIDEVLTPDSSRYWPKDDYSVGRSQHAYDKQYVRDYLNTLDWDKTPPGPKLPEEVISNTFERYLEAYERLINL